MSMSSRRFGYALLMVGLLTTVAGGGQAQGDAEGAGPTAFVQLKELVGHWKGSYRWMGSRSGSGPIAARYSLTGAGSALNEDLMVNGTVVMSSVYHLDGPDLRLTHYCAAGNQPRLKATEVDAAAFDLRFSFVDITNLKAPDAGHVRRVRLQRHAPDSITLTFTFVGGAGEADERIELTRESQPVAQALRPTSPAPPGRPTVIR